VHPVFAGDAYASLQAAGAAKIVTCNTITHPSNQIEVSKVLAAAVQQFLHDAPVTSGHLE
jgi:ribose-phosphate pyrophosphokinase